MSFLETFLPTRLTRRLRPMRDAAFDRWVGAFMALAVTCLLSLIPLKVPAMNPFWYQDAFQERVSEAGSQLAAEEQSLSGVDDEASVGTSPLSVHAGDRVLLDPGLIAAISLLFAGIRANARIPAKRVRQIALPPPTPFQLRAPPSRV